MLAALLVSTAAFFAAALYSLITVEYGCSGSDVSEPPPEGSTGDLLCPAPAVVLHLALGGLAVIAPLFALSPWPRWFDLRVGSAVSAGSILVLGVLGRTIDPTTGGLLVLPPLVVFAGAVVMAARPRQARGGDAP